MRLHYLTGIELSRFFYLNGAKFALHPVSLIEIYYYLKGSEPTSSMVLSSSWFCPPLKKTASPSSSFPCSVRYRSARLGTVPPPALLPLGVPAPPQPASSPSPHTCLPAGRRRSSAASTPPQPASSPSRHTCPGHVDPQPRWRLHPWPAAP